eukprot:384725-Hanusia_phi.AAC.1
MPGLQCDQGPGPAGPAPGDHVTASSGRADSLSGLDRLGSDWSLSGERTRTRLPRKQKHHRVSGIIIILLPSTTEL